MVIVFKALKTTFFSFKEKGSFANNIKYYTLYFAITFIVQLIFTPVVARVFTAEAYGTFSLVTSLATYISLFFTLQLEPAIVVKKTDREARVISNALFTMNGYAVVLSYFLLSAVFLYCYYFSTISIENIIYLFWVPLLSSLIAAHNIYGNVANRSKQYKKIYQVMSPTYLLSKVLTIGWGKFIHNNFFGLFVGEVSFRTCAVLLGFKFIVGDRLSKHIKLLSFSQVYSIAKKNASYIIYELPLRVISLLSTQMPIYFMAIYYDVATIGQFAFANALLEIPVRLISYSFATVFFQKSSEVVNAGGGMLKRSLKLLAGLFFLGIPPFLLLYLFSDEIFLFLFGSQWQYASKLASSLVLFYFSRFVFEPFQVLFRVFGKQQKQFVATIIYFLTFGVYLLLSMRSGLELTQVFKVMSFISVIYFAAQTLYIFQLMRYKKADI